MVVATPSFVCVAVSLNEEVADRSYEVRLNAPTLLAVVLSSSSDAPSLLPCFDAQVVKEVGCVGGAQQEATEGFESLDAGVLILNTVKMFKKGRQWEWVRQHAC